MPDHPMAHLTPQRRRTWSALLLLGGLWLGACQATPPVSPPAPAPSPQDLMAQINAEIGDARCEQDQQCRSLPVGHKACGGPSGHLAWSTLVSDEGRLRALARQQAQASQAAQARAGVVSDCMLVADPGARCNTQTRRCELRPRGQAGPSAL